MNCPRTRRKKREYEKGAHPLQIRKICNILGRRHAVERPEVERGRPIMAMRFWSTAEGEKTALIRKEAEGRGAGEKTSIHSPKKGGHKLPSTWKIQKIGHWGGG